MKPEPTPIELAAMSDVDLPPIEEAPPSIESDDIEEPPAVESDRWNVTLSIPEDRASAIFSNFTALEQFDAITYVLQKRMDTL